MKLEDDQYCFACGKRNPIGLYLTFENRDDITESTFIPKKEHQGYFNYVHGGISTTLLDELMAQWLITRGFMVVTVKIEATFRKPVPIEKPCIIRAKYGRKKGRFHYMTGEITDELGMVLVSGEGIFSEVK